MNRLKPVSRVKIDPFTFMSKANVVKPVVGLIGVLTLMLVGLLALGLLMKSGRDQENVLSCHFVVYGGFLLGLLTAGLMFVLGRRYDHCAWVMMATGFLGFFLGLWLRVIVSDIPIPANVSKLLNENTSPEHCVPGDRVSLKVTWVTSLDGYWLLKDGVVTNCTATCSNGQRIEWNPTYVLPSGGRSWATGISKLDVHNTLVPVEIQIGLPNNRQLEGASARVVVLGKVSYPKNPDVVRNSFEVGTTDLRTVCVFRIGAPGESETVSTATRVRRVLGWVDTLMCLVGGALIWAAWFVNERYERRLRDPQYDHFLKRRRR